MYRRNTQQGYRKIDAQAFSLEVAILSWFSAVGPIPAGYTCPRAEGHFRSQSEQQSPPTAGVTALSSFSAIGAVGTGPACPRSDGLPGEQSEQQSSSEAKESAPASVQAAK